jgi:hypothetical protein
LVKSNGKPVKNQATPQTGGLKRPEKRGKTPYFFPATVKKRFVRVTQSETLKPMNPRSITREPSGSSYILLTENPPGHKLFDHSHLSQKVFGVSPDIDQDRFGKTG